MDGVLDPFGSSQRGNARQHESAAEGLTRGTRRGAERIRDDDVALGHIAALKL